MPQIELTPTHRPRKIRHVLMDWDGTTSFSRAGWGEVMVGVYVENLPRLAGETDESRAKFAWEELMSLNGRPAIHQMARLAELIQQRGGTPLTADDYQADFQRRLSDLVRSRLDDIRSGKRDLDWLLVPGVRAFFETLRARGIALTLASGTPLSELMVEVNLFNVAHYFEGRIFGPRDLHDSDFQKRIIVQQLLTQHGVDGETLAAFGDGQVELVETMAVGGMAIAVASDETREHPGRVDAWKRQILLAAGAHVVIPDFQNPEALLTALGT